MITREQAYEIARAEVEHDCPIAGQVRVGRVVAGDDPAAARIFSYTTERFRPEDHWIAFVESDCEPALGPSLVLILSKKDGQIVFQGKADDEG